jgi:predicted metal-dependent hydrolase
MVTTLKLGTITVDVLKKDIKNVHLSVHPPAGRVKISAPLRMDMGTIRLFAVAKLGWIKQQQKKVTEQERESQRDCVDRESHYVWGKRYLLKVVEKDCPPQIELRQNKMVMHFRPAANAERRREFLDEWYRKQIKSVVRRSSLSGK